MDERKKEKKENSTELQKPNVEAEVYNNNKKCDWGKKKLKSLESFLEPLVACNQKASLASLSPLLCPFRHLEGSLAWGPFLSYWLGSYTVDQHVRHLKGHPGWGPTL